MDSVKTPPAPPITVFKFVCLKTLKNPQLEQSSCGFFYVVNKSYYVSFIVRSFIFITMIINISSDKTLIDSVKLITALLG